MKANAMPSTAADIYRQHIVVAEADLDEMRHVNNVRYLQWLQDGAILHWQQLADEALRTQYAWVARHHSLDYLAAAWLGDELLLETWVDECRGALSTRHYRLSRLSDKQTVVQAHTQWCLLNRSSLKPVRIPAAVAALFRCSER